MQPSETPNCLIRLERQSTDCITVSPSCVGQEGTKRIGSCPSASESTGMTTLERGKIKVKGTEKTGPELLELPVIITRDIDRNSP